MNQLNKMFVSLMLDTLRQRVDSATELKKADVAGQQLLAVLKDIPSFKDMARIRLGEALREYHPGVELNKVFVNRGSYTEDLENRPVGSLLEVHLECLSRNLHPDYGIGSDGVYDRPNTTDSQFKVPGLDIYQVERLLKNARENLSWKHRNSLDQYWKAAANGQVDGNPFTYPQGCSAAIDSKDADGGAFLERYRWAAGASPRRAGCRYFTVGSWRLAVSGGD
jgi:hypothetical protein